MSIFSTMLELHLSGLKSILFYPEDQKMFLSAFLCSKEQMSERSIFEKNHGPTPLQNVHFLKFFRTYLAWCKKYSFLSRITKNVFFAFFAQKKHMRKRSIFWQKPWTNPFAKCRFFLTSWELHFWGPKSLIFSPEYPKMLLFGFFC